MRTIQSLLLVTLSTGAAAAQQHPCFANLVKNPGFESQLVDPWVVAGPVVASPARYAVDGVTESRCLALRPTSNTAFTLRQPTPIVLEAGIEYEFAVDVWSDHVIGLECALVDAGSRTVVGSYAVAGHTRFSAQASVPNGGSFELEFQFYFWSGHLGTSHRVDNVLVRPLRAARFAFSPGRASAPSQSFTIKGPPNAFTALFLSGGLYLPAGLSLAGCEGEWLLGLPAFLIVNVSLDTSGSYQGSIDVPAAIAGTPLHWQVALLPPACALNCPVMIGFP